MNRFCVHDIDSILKTRSQIEAASIAWRWLVVVNFTKVFSIGALSNNTYKQALAESSCNNLNDSKRHRRFRADTILESFTKTGTRPLNLPKATYF